MLSLIFHEVSVFVLLTKVFRGYLLKT
jgi:hypothetical protein